jgi:WD40 repeat protein
MYKCELDQLSYFYPPIYLAAMMIRRTLFLAFVCFVVSCASAFAQKPELVVQTGHNTDFIQQIAFSPNGKILATAGLLDRNIKLWHIETGKEIASFLQTNEIGVYLGFQWQGDTLLHSASWTGRTIKFKQWNTKERKLLALTTSKTEQYSRGVSYNPKALLCCIDADSTEQKFKNMQGKDSLAIVKDSVLILETTTGNIRAILPQSGKTSAQFSPDGTLILTTDNAERLSLWDATTFQRLHTITLPASKINGTRWNPDSKLLAISVHDTTLFILNAATRQVIATMNGHSGEIHDIVFSPDGQRLFTVSNDSTLKLWDVQKGIFLKTLAKFPETTASVAVSPDGRTLALTTYPAQRTVYILDAETGAIKHSLRGGLQGIFPTITANVLGNGAFLSRKDIPVSRQQVKTDNSEILRYWDFAAIAEPIRHITKQLSQSQTDIFRTVSDTLIACEYNQQTLIVWNPNSRQILQRFSFLPPNAIQFAAISNNKTMVAISLVNQSNDDAKNILIALNCRTGKELWRDSSSRFMSRMGGISMMFSPNDSLIITLDKI